jgi:PPOX class probable F420-dependent enzyme
MELHDALEFIRDRQHGVLITLKADGRPQSSNITFALGDDDLIRISVTDTRAKTTNMRRDPRVSLHVNRDDFYEYVVIEAEASMTPTAASVDDDTVEQLIDYYRTVVGEHPDWDDYRQAMVTDRRLLLTLTPTRAYGMLSG